MVDTDTARHARHEARPSERTSESPYPALAPAPLAAHVASVDLSPLPALTLTAQTAWAATPCPARLAILRRFRHLLADHPGAVASAIPPNLHRTRADTLASELLPLLDACRFLEKNAARILAPRRLGRKGLPLWLTGISSEIHRSPFGQILILGPGNYPLFLPGVQALQALAAGNAVVWKPGTGGRPIADIVARTLAAAGLPAHLLHITGDTTAAADAALSGQITGALPDKVFLTGSADTGRAVLARLASTLTPCVAELSGSDALIVLPSADLDRVARAVAFGMRLNGSAVCMAPRRLLLVDADPHSRDTLVRSLLAAFADMPGVALPAATATGLRTLVEDAIGTGARLHGTLASPQKPLLVTNALPSMPLTQADLFAPIISLIEVSGEAALIAANEACPYALTVAIFAAEPDIPAARALAARLTAGTVLINDIIVPTIDPRLPFTGRRNSGFGSIRGTEGLLEMTTPRVVSLRRGRSTLHYDPTGPDHEALFAGLIRTSHAGTVARRWIGLKALVTAARILKPKL